MSSEHEWRDDAAEVSGFGGVYEEACRAMVARGVEWLDTHPDADPIIREAENVFGLIEPRNDDAMKLTNAMSEAAKRVAGEGPTGAMMQMCVSHAGYAHEHGWDDYQEAMADGS